MNKRSIALAFAVIPLLTAQYARADDCRAVSGANIVHSKEEFFSDARKGQLAWLRDGKSSSTFYLLNPCSIIYVPSTSMGILYFNINDVTLTASASVSFVAVQVAKIQEAPAQDHVTIERNDNWMRDGKPQKDIETQTILGMSVRKFMGLHSQPDQSSFNPDKPPFNDDLLRPGGRWWHATPTNMDSSITFSWGSPWNWDPPPALKTLLETEPNNIVLSNRLYRFEGNNGHGMIGIPFNVELNSTNTIFISIYSPAWPELTITYELRLRK